MAVGALRPLLTRPPRVCWDAASSCGSEVACIDEASSGLLGETSRAFAGGRWCGIHADQSSG